MKSFLIYTEQKKKIVINLFIISGLILLCFPAIGFLFPAKEITTSGIIIFEQFFNIAGFGFVGASAIWRLSFLLIHHIQFTTSFPQPLTGSEIIAGLIGQIIYFYLIACVFVWFKNKHRKNNTLQ